MGIETIALQIGIAMLLIVGIGLTMLALPGNAFIFIVALVYAYYEQFTRIDFGFLGWLFGALLLGESVEFVAGAMGAKRQNASKGAMAAAIVGAIIGGVIGTGILPIVGSVAGAMTGAFAASFAVEFATTGNIDKSKKVAMSVMAGQMIGMLFKIVVGIGMAIAVLIRLPWFS